MWKVALLRALLLALLLTTTGGCTTQLTATRAGQQAQPGQVYFLPRVEHLVTLDRELTKCETRVPMQRLAQEWFRAEVANLVALSDKLNSSGLAGQHPACGAIVVAKMESSFKSAYDTVAKLLPEKPPATCGSIQDPEFKKAYDEVLRALLVEFRKDPIFSSRVGWGSADECKEDALDLSKFDSPVDVNGKLTDLNRCPKKFDLKGTEVEVDIEVAMAAVAAAHALPDRDHAYSIQYADVAKGLKKTNYTVVKYPNGTLKSINAGIEDRTAEVIQSTIGGALKILAATQGVPLGIDEGAAAVASGAGVPQTTATVRAPSSFKVWSNSPAAPQPQPLCKQSVVQLLQSKAKLESAVDKAAKDVLAFAKEEAKKLEEADEAETEAAVLQKEHDALPADSAERAKLKVRIDSLKAAEKAARAAAKKAEKDRKAFEEVQAGSNKALANVRKKLTVTHSHWHRSEAPIQDEEVNGAAEAASAWFENVDALCVKLACDQPLAGPKIPKELKAYVASYLSPKTPVVASEKGCLDPQKSGAIVYREPAKGLLLVCQKEKCLDAHGAPQVTPANAVLMGVADFPQLGVLGSLPLVNELFQNNTLVASFSETGSLQSLTYESNARAEKAAEVFESTADEVLQFTEAKRGAKKRDIETKTEEIKAETERIKAQKALEDALKALKDATEASDGEANPEG